MDTWATDYNIRIVWCIAAGMAAVVFITSLIAPEKKKEATSGAVQ